MGGGGGGGYIDWWIMALFNSRVLRISSKSRYAGDEAAAWFSTLLNKPGCKMYQIYEPRDSTKDTKWGDLASPGDKVHNSLLPRTSINSDLLISLLS